MYAAATIILLLGCPVVYGQKKGSPPTRDAKDSQNAESPRVKANASSTIVVIQQKTTGQQNERTADDSQGYFACLFSPENLPNIGLFLAGIAGIIVAVCTLKNIQKQTNATEKAAGAAKDNADIALLNTQVVLNSERPWLVVTAERNGSTGEVYFHFRVTNKGRTPAQLVSGTVDYTFATRPDQLPIPPPYETAFYAPPNRFLVQDDWFNIRRTQSEANIGVSPLGLLKSRRAQTDKAQPGEFLIVFGQIIYDDVLGKGRPDYKQHRTRWCFAFFEHGQTFETVGPEEYNEYT